MGRVEATAGMRGAQEERVRTLDQPHVLLSKDLAADDHWIRRRTHVPWVDEPRTVPVRLVDRDGQSTVVDRGDRSVDAHPPSGGEVDHDQPDVLPGRQL